MSNPILPSFVHDNKHAVSMGLGLGTGLVANQVFEMSILDSALIGGGIALLSEALITLDAPSATVFSAPGITVAAVVEGDAVRVTSTSLVPEDKAKAHIVGLTTMAEEVSTKKGQKGRKAS